MTIKEVLAWIGIAAVPPLREFHNDAVHDSRAYAAAMLAGNRRVARLSSDIANSVKEPGSPEAIERQNRARSELDLTMETIAARLERNN